ncbi:hypothetical protein V5799_022223 [Amblyomma americanum]|uniref:Uncharacterized protein n=1 Tax=Amblyomma americanum TaxID=6943 RepID=A0AAQ4FML5_AMBAM
MMDSHSPNAGAGSSFSGRSPATGPPILRLERNKVTGAVAGAACSLSLVAATCLIVWLLVTQQAWEHRVNTTDAPFCCPDEAAQLFAVISRSVPPCSDFFAYVCYNAIKDGFIQEGVSLDILHNIKGNIIRGVDRYGSPAAAALHGFYTSCLNEIWQRDRRQREIASVLLDEVGANETMGHAELLRFALASQKRYRLNFFFTITDHKFFTMIDRNYVRSSDYKRFCEDDCFLVALSVVNARLRTNYTRGDFFAWERQLPGDDEDDGNYELATEELLDALGNMNTSLLEAILREFFPSFNLTTPAYATAKKGLLDDIRILWNVSNQPLSLLYMLTTVVIDAISQIQIDKVLDAPTPRTWRICDAHGQKHNELWHATYVAALTSPAKNRRMRAVFEATREAMVNYAPLRRLAAAGNQTEHLDALLGNMSLVLPSDLVLGHVAVPVMPPRGFVRNYFRGLSFEFDVKREKLRRGIFTPLLAGAVHHGMERINETSLYVPPTAYSTLGANTSSPLLVDASMIATDMAALIWRAIRLHEHWKSETIVAFEYHR